ncbi:MAG: T3SS effector HopA1 family protein, partial [Burkholderiales bacterium]
MSCFSKVTQRKLEVIAADVAIIGRRLFQLASELPEMVSSQVTSYPNESLANDLVSSLTNALYLKYYCGCRSPMSRDVSRTDLLTGLRNANASLDGWDDGWKIIDRNTEGQVVVRSGARTRLIALEDASVLGPSDSGDARLSIRRRREDFESQPGYYYAIGDAIGDQYEDQVGARIYLNLKVEAAETWMWRVTTELNRYRLPFQFKVLRHSASFVRIDSGIIYVPRRHAGFAASLIADLALVVGGLGDRTPLFTRRVAGGIALADNPPGGASFGLSRMRLVAEGHIDAWSDQSSDVRSRVKAIASRFRRAGVDPLRPWLNPGDNTDVILQPAVPRARA